MSIFLDRYKCDTPQVIYANPACEMIARFVGFKNFFPISTAERIGLSVPQDRTNALLWCIRPEKINLVDSVGAMCTGTVEVRTYLGESYQYEVKTELGTMIVASPLQPPKVVGEQVGLYIAPNHVVFLDR